MTSTHYLSIEPVEFRELAHGRQHALSVPRGEGVLLGDQLVLREWRPSVRGGRGAYTGAWLMRRVTSVLEGPGIELTHAVYSLNTGAENERAVVVLKRQIGLAEQQGVPVDRFLTYQARREQARRGVLRKSAEVVARVRAARARGIGGVEGGVDADHPGSSG